MESNILVRYNSAQRSFMDPSSSTSSWRNSNDDVDFNDVFGGPPRRYSSASDVRNNSMSEATTESRRFSRDDESISSGSVRWSGLGDKPVFGEEVTNRRRNTSDDFFDDIFRSSLEDKDSMPSLPSRTEPFSGSSLPAQLSLADILNKGMDDNRKSPLSMEFSLGSDGSVKVTESETESEIISKKDLNGSSDDVPINRSQFHFSIHKWASKGAPPMFSLRNAKSSSKVKDNVSLSKCMTSKRRIENEDSTFSKLPVEETLTGGLDFFNDLELEKHDDELLFNTVIQDNTILSSLHEKCEEKKNVTTKLFEEANKSELEPLPSMLYKNDDEQSNTSKNETTKETSVKENMESITKKTTANISVGGAIKKRDGKRVIHNDAEEHRTSLHGSPAHIGENLERNKIKGKVSEFVKIFNQETPSKRVTNADAQFQNRRREGVGALKAEKAVEVNAARVDDIVSTPIVDKKKISVARPVKGPSVQLKEFKISATRADGKLSTRTPTTENQKISVNTPVQVEQHSTLLNESKLDIEATYTTIPIVSDAYEQKDSSSSTASISDGSKATFASIDDFFEDNFSMQEIFIDQTKPPEIGKDEEEFRASDAKIREWSYGKETNIRSLLSTLQYVLWDGSGWKPVPLVNIIEGNAVKRAYQRALLCLHPDKLQQKGASALTKYIAEKVFDILQDAWENFNSLGSI